MRSLLTLCFGCSLWGQSLLPAPSSFPHTDGLFWSQTAFAAAGAMDIAGSWGAQELNPITGTGRFGGRQAATSAVMTAGVIVVGHLVVKRWPGTRRWIMWSNYGGAGVRGYAVMRTMRAER